MTKLKAKPITYKNIRFASKAEASLAKQLDDEAIEWEYEADKFEYVIKPQTYKPDFRIGPDTYIECKGFFPHKDRQKMLAVKEQYPDKKFYLAFLKPNTKISKGPKGKTYARWAWDNGFELWRPTNQAGQGQDKI